MLKLQKEQSIATIEKWLTIVADTDSSDVAINTDLYYSDFGGVGALLQLLITWSKRHPDGRLVLHAKDPEIARRHIENLSGFHHGLIGILLASDVVTSDGAASLLKDARYWAKKRVEEMIAEKSLSSDVMFFCADQTTKKFIPQFYFPGDSPHGVLRPEGEFVALAESLLVSLAGKFKSRIPSHLEEKLGTILYELFKNTHQWARAELDGSVIKRSVRGIRIHMIRPAVTQAQSFSALHQAYLSNLSVDGDDKCDLIELSVFDSGPGLAARGLSRTIGDDVTPEEEYRGVVACLRLHQTSSEKSHHGVGLLEVMRTLTGGRCFLRLRTGRLALYRDFASSPLSDESDLWLSDWVGGRDRLTSNAFAEGTLLSILLPVVAEKRKK